MELAKKEKILNESLMNMNRIKVLQFSVILSLFVKSCYSVYIFDPWEWNALIFTMYVSNWLSCILAHDQKLYSQGLRWNVWVSTQNLKIWNKTCNLIDHYKLLK